VQTAKQLADDLREKVKLLGYDRYKLVIQVGQLGCCAEGGATMHGSLTCHGSLLAASNVSHQEKAHNTNPATRGAARPAVHHDGKSLNASAGCGGC
jgi:hypothetical protein